MLDPRSVSAIPFQMVIFSFIVFLIRWCLSFLFSPRTHKNLPPSPPTFPILGNLLQLGLYPHRTFQKLAQLYGPLMLLHFGNGPVLVVSSSEAARLIMKTHDVNFLNRPKSYIVAGHLYYGKDVTTLCYGDSWRQMKSLCTLQLLSDKRVRSFRSIREEEVALFVENVIRQSCSLSLPVNLSEMFAFFTNDVTCRVVFNKKYGREETGNMVDEVLTEMKKLLGGFYVGEYIPWLAWVHRVSGVDAAVDRLNKDFKFIPFGSGRRICPGILFAMFSNELLLANLVHKFDWTLPGGANAQDLDMIECTGSTIHRRVALVAVATPRDADGML